MAWKGVITNGGSELLAQWTAGKTLTVTRAAAGTGRVDEAAMLAQTALAEEKQTASILANRTTEQGQKMQVQVTPQTTGYALNQIGVWAKLDEEEAKMIALFQTDTDAGVEIPSKADVPDYAYTFYGLLKFNGTGGTLQVTIDPSALVTHEDLEEALAQLDAGDIAGAVRYDAAQSLSDAEKTRARSNIGAERVGATPTYQPNVSYPANAQVVWKGNAWKNTSGQSVTGVEPGTNYKVWNVGYSNPNLLDNPWFTINQRGKSEYTPDDGFDKYTIDRWKSFWGQKVVVNGYGKGLTCTLANNLCQFINHDLSESLRGKDVTLSVKLIDGSVYAVTATIPMVSQTGDLFMEMKFDKTYPGLSDMCIVNLKDGYSSFYTGGFMVSLYGGQYGATTWIAIKLELGPVSTLANDGPPDYATELAKCQRYFYRMGGNNGDLFRASDNTSGYAMVHFPVPMRAIPTISGKIIVWPGNKESTSMSLASETLMPYGLTGVAIRVTGFTGLVDDRIYTIQVESDVNITADL